MRLVLILGLGSFSVATFGTAEPGWTRWGAAWRRATRASHRHQGTVQPSNLSDSPTPVLETWPVSHPVLILIKIWKPACLPHYRSGPTRSSRTLTSTFGWVGR